MIRKLFLIILVVLVFVWPVWGTDWYVRPVSVCSNNGDGTAHDCASMPGAVGAWNAFTNVMQGESGINPGDVLWLDGDATYSSESFDSDVSGTSGNPITIRGDYGGGQAIIDVNSTENFGIKVDQSYIIVKDVLIRESIQQGVYVASTASVNVTEVHLINLSTPDNGLSGIKIHCPDLGSGSSITNIDITDCTAGDNEVCGIVIGGYWTVSGINVTGGSVYGNGTPSVEGQGLQTIMYGTNVTSGWVQYDSSDVWYHAADGYPVNGVCQISTSPRLLTENDGAYATLSDGEWDLYNDSLYVNIGKEPNGENIRIKWGTVSGIHVEGLYAHDNDSASGGVGGNGVYLDWWTTDSYVRYCRLQNNEGSGLAACAVSSCDVYGNTITDNGQNASHTSGSGVFTRMDCRDLAFHNNTLRGNDQDGFVFKDSGDGFSLKNNIVASNGDHGIDNQGSITNVVEDYNCFHQNTTGDRNGVSAGPDSFNSDPLTVDPAAGDFRLRWSSPCIDAGTDLGLTRDHIGRYIPHGRAPDIGAYEAVVSRPYVSETPETVAQDLVKGTVRH